MEQITQTTKLPSKKEYDKAYLETELISWLTQLRETKRFPISNRPSDWFIDKIIEELKSGKVHQET